MTDREKKLNTDREWLADELMRAGSPALPSSLSAAALFERMDAEEQRAAEPAAPAPEKKGGVIWLQWRRWGSAAAVLVLAVGVAFLLQNGTLQKKSFNEPALAEPGYDMAMAPNGAENRDQQENREPARRLLRSFGERDPCAGGRAAHPRPDGF